MRTAHVVLITATGSNRETTEASHERLQLVVIGRAVQGKSVPALECRYPALEMFELALAL
jgi:hypothetical protein